MTSPGLWIARILEPVIDCLTPETAAKVASLRADEETQTRIDFLADRANEGLLTVIERFEYEQILEAVNAMTILQARARKIVGPLAKGS